MGNKVHSGGASSILYVVHTLVIFADKRRGGGGLQLVFQVSVCVNYMSLIRNKEQVTGN